MSITNKLNQIKNAIYGKEVRGAIHDAIKQVYDDASVNHDNANMEVKMARGTHNTLNDRLDNVDEIQAQTNAQLSQSNKMIDELMQKTSYVVVVNNAMTTPEINKITNPDDKTKRYKVIFETGIYELTETMIFDVSVVEVDFQQSKLIANNVENGAIVTVNSNYASEFVAQKSLNGLYIEKNSKTGVGLVLQNCSDVKFENCRIKGFEKSVEINDNTYLNTFYKCSLSNSIYCVYMDRGKSNYGERITFIDCNIGNSEWTLYNANGDGDIYFTNCSFDFNTSGFFTVAGGKTYVTDCHIEFQNSALRDCISNVTGNGGTLIIRGGWILGQGSQPLMLNAFKGSAYVKIEDVFFHNIRTTGNLASDNLNIDIVNPNSYRFHEVTNFKTNNKNNLVGDSTFNEILDVVQILEDTGTISDPLTGVNLTIQPSVSGLEIKKLYGGGSASQFIIAVPITKKRITSSITIKKSNDYGRGGTCYLRNGYAKIYPLSNGQHKIKFVKVFGTTNIDIQSSSTYEKTFTTNGSLPYESDGTLNIIKNVTHYFYAINMANFDGNNGRAIIHITDLFVEEF